MFRIRSFRLIAFSAGLLVGTETTWVAADEAAYGPLYQEFKLTLTGGDRREALGPLYYAEDELQETDNLTRTWAAPPIFSYVLNEDIDYEKFDFLWKLITYDRFGDEYRFQFVQL